MRIDLHVHTRESSGAPNYWLARALGVRECYSQPEEVLEEARRKGLDGVALTNHDRAQDALRLAAAHPDFVIPGCEYKVYGGKGRYADVVVLGITARLHDLLMRERHRGIERLTRVTREEGLPAILAHPAWEVSHEKQGIDPAILCEWIESFELVEAVNGQCPAESVVARGLARYLGKVSTGGSDSHDIPSVGVAWTEADASGLPEFMERLRAGQVRPGGHAGSVAQFAATTREVLGAFYRGELLRAVGKGSVRDFLLQSSLQDVLRALGQVLILPGLWWAPQVKNRFYMQDLQRRAGELRRRLVDHLSLELSRQLALEDMTAEERRQRWVRRMGELRASFPEEGS